MSIEAHLRHRFGAFALDVSFRIEERGITALFGPSGSGKTTTINALSGLFRPCEGRIVIDERVVLDTERGIFVPARERRIGYVFQDTRLFPHMSVRDNLYFGWRRTGRSDAVSFGDILALLGLESLLSRKPARLSGGERNRVALGRALLANPTLLLLDEPLASLDARRREEIIPYLERLRDQARIPMFYVTHSVEELSRLADQVVVLKSGRVTSQESVFDLLSSLEFSSLTGVAAYGATIPVCVLEQRGEDGLTLLGFDGGELVVPRIERRVGAPLRVRIRAEDIMLARERPAAISANNVLDATATGIRSDGGVYADVQLACGGIRLIARITRASLVRLNIAAGMPLFAIVKSVTLESPGAGSDDPLL
ncbi:MAG TPA: molybdenum ABC transporter ATP-binding protein [Rhizomicrobium sp.]